jgi:hypothetical protein
MEPPTSPVLLFYTCFLGMLIMLERDHWLAVKRRFGQSSWAVCAKCLQGTVTLHLLYYELDQAVDRLIHVGRVKGISNTSPD